MRGKPTRGRRRIQMLHDLASDDGYVARHAPIPRGVPCSVQQPASPKFLGPTYAPTV